jgi:hypothetical protein
MLFNKTVAVFETPGVRIGMDVMLSNYRHWLEYDPMALAVPFDRATTAGADSATLSVIDAEDIPIAYLPGNARRVRSSARKSVASACDERSTEIRSRLILE